MKKIFTTIVSVAAAVCVIAQAPQKMSYQAVVRTSGGSLVTNQEVGTRVSILQGSPTGTLIYQEIYNPNPQTNVNGLVSLEIGGGTPQIGTFSTIDWSSGPYFLKTETDPTGGANYTITGTSQILSVPYALYANTVASYNETDPIFGVWNKSTGISIASSQISDFQASVTNHPAVVANTAKNSYPTADAIKLASIAVGAEVNVNPDWNASSGDAQILNRPIISVGTNPGDMQYWNGTTWVMIPVGQPGQFLQLTSSNIPAWSGAIPTITTTAASSITGTTAISGGNVASDGGVSIIARGVCWNTSPNPIITNYKTTDGTGTGIFTSSLTGLTPGNTYYVRAYATNSVGTAYGNELSFTALAIGNNYQGGIIAYILQPGDPGYSINVQHGLIAASSDQGLAQWGCDGIMISGADGTAIGTGNQNTIDIISGCSTAGIAAKLCSDLELNGYSDWYLPSKDELNKLFINMAAIGDFDETAYYWSSTEISIMEAWLQYFYDGSQGAIYKDNTFNVRAIRAF